MHTVLQGEKYDYVRLKFIRHRVKLSTGSGWAPLTEKGSRKCFAVYKAHQQIKRGNKGSWLVDVIPHFKSFLSDQQIEYGCVIMVASNKYHDVYKPITRYLRTQIAVPYVVAKEQTETVRSSEKTT